MIAEQPLDRAEFDFVAERRRGAVCVDVIDSRRVVLGVAARDPVVRDFLDRRPPDSKGNAAKFLKFLEELPDS